MKVLRVLDALDASFSPVLGFLPSECVCKQSQNATKSPEPECNEKSKEKEGITGHARSVYITKEGASQ